MRSRAKQESSMKAKELDDVFLFHMLEIERKYVDLPKFLCIRTERWIEKLSVLATTSNLAWKRNRNEYSAMLLSMVSTRDFKEPFHALPPAGPLRKLPGHMTLSLGKWMQRSDDKHKREFWEDVYTKIADDKGGKSVGRAQTIAAGARDRHQGVHHQEKGHPSVHRALRSRRDDVVKDRRIDISRGYQAGQGSSSGRGGGRGEETAHGGGYRVRETYNEGALLDGEASQQASISLGNHSMDSAKQKELSDYELEKKQAVEELVMQLDKTNDALRLTAEQCDQERSERLRLESQLKEAEVLLRGQAQRIELLETELKSMRRKTARDKEQLMQLHELEIAELNRLHAQEIKTMELTTGSGHRTGKGLFDLIEQSAALDESHAKDAGSDLSQSIGAFVEPGKSNSNTSDADFLGYLGELQSKISLATKAGVVPESTAGTAAAEEEKEEGHGSKYESSEQEEGKGEQRREEETTQMMTLIMAEDRKGTDIFPGAGGTATKDASVLSRAAATPVRRQSGSGGEGGGSSALVAARGLLVATPDSLNEG